MTDRHILVLSDIEMGAGGLADDFPHDAFLREVIESRTAKLAPDERVELVLNGDTLDFMMTSVDGEFPSHITAELARKKLDRIVAAHGPTFEALREFLSQGDRRVHFVVGNHDAELLFPEVQAQLQTLCGRPDRVNFPGFALNFGPVHIEHGSQLDPMFAIPPAHPFVRAGHERVLNQPWGTLALSNIYSLLKHELYALARIRPRARLFELIPQARLLMQKRSWNYFTGDFWRDFRSDPLKRVTWPMIREVSYRFRTSDPDVALGKHHRELLAASPARLFVVGHEHHAAQYSFGGKTLMTSACLRNEYIVDAGGVTPEPAEKGAIEIAMSADRIARAELLVFPPPEPPPGHMPNDVRELRPLVDRCLAQLGGSEPEA